MTQYRRIGVVDRGTIEKENLSVIARSKRCTFVDRSSPALDFLSSCHKRQKPQAPIRNRQTRKVANAKGLNRNTNLA